MENSLRTLLVTLLFFVAIPSLAHAQLVVSEIMYDLAEGQDAGREWIELFNSGAGTVDVSQWRLFESGVNHKIAASRGGASLPSGGYAVVADNPTKFLVDHPTYTGQLFESSFSLSNKGETLIVRDPEGIDTDVVGYQPSLGAAGDGASLSRTSTKVGIFSSLSPSPGIGSLTVVPAAAKTAAPTIVSAAPQETVPTIAAPTKKRVQKVSLPAAKRQVAAVEEAIIFLDEADQMVGDAEVPAGPDHASSSEEASPQPPTLFPEWEWVAALLGVLGIASVGIVAGASLHANINDHVSQEGGLSSTDDEDESDMLAGWTIIDADEEAR